MSAYIADVNAALIATLAGDAALTAILGGAHVYLNLAPQGLTKFVLLRLDNHRDERMFGGTAFEVATYLVKAVIQATDLSAVIAAAARVNALLDGQSLTLTNYGLMAMRRVEHIEFGEVDDVNRAWQHGGGVYEVWVSPVATP